jgi:hypothetical protein
MAGKLVDRNTLQMHVFNAYIHMRRGMAVIGIAFPIVVYLAGRYDDVGLRHSISEYYWQAGAGADFFARTWFVGGLFALAALLFLYKGFSFLESAALNLAALFAVGVAIFPMPHDCKPYCPRLSLHGFCAMALFACLVYVVWFRARDTLQYLPPQEGGVPRAVLIGRYKALYLVIGLWQRHL